MVQDVVTRWSSAYHMLERAIYLRKVVDTFVRDFQWDQLELSKSEWDQAEFLLNVLLPFKACSARLEQTTRPGIDKVFWVYESLFNELDRLSTIAEDRINSQHTWLQAVKPALSALRAKLSKYYGNTARSFVYPNGVIFQPRGKLTLFKQQSWDDDEITKYSAMCRDRYVAEYEGTKERSVTPISNRKRPFSVLEDDDEEYEQALQALNPSSDSNEYDRYILSPRVDYKIGVLDWWRQNDYQYPQMSLMVRDTLAVPATGAGVERQFSKSGRVVTPTRSRLSPETITDILLYKNYLSRKKEEIKTWTGAGMTAGEEEDILSDVVEQEDDVLKEWRDGWWIKKKQRQRTL